jgi:hypothetical protein
VIRRSDGAWVLCEDSNPSSASPAVASAPGIAAVVTDSRRLGLRLVSGLTAAQAQSIALAERVERLRYVSAEQQARTLALLARCEATRARAIRARGGRLSSQAAAAPAP